MAARSSTSSYSDSDSERETDSSASGSSCFEYNSTPIKPSRIDTCDNKTPRKRKYRRSLHYGLSSKRANYYKVTPEKSASLYLPERVDNSAISDDEKNKSVRTITPEVYQLYSSSSSLSQSSVSTDSFDSEWEGSETSHSQPFSETSEFTHCDSDSFQEPDFTEGGEEKSFQEPLYNGCKLTENAAYTMIMVFVQKHSLSNEALTDLLLLISACLPQSAKFAKTTYKVKEIMKSAIGFQEPILHYYCDICQKYSEQENICGNEACRRNNSKMLAFHDLRLEDQLKDMFKDDVFYKTIKREVQLQQSRNGSKLYDITDGTVYRENLKSLQKNADLYLTFTMNTDGVSLFSSSKKGSLWPVYIAINELPLKLRFSRKYLMTCYLHCQVEKPNMLTFLTPLVKILQRLHSHGIQVETSAGTVLVKANLIASCLDLPAGVWCPI